MIKKFNKLMDDIPLIFKLILGVIMCAILTLMGLILFFFFLPEVNAQAVNPTSNEIHTELIAGGGEQYINIGQNQDYTLAVSRKYDFFVSNFLNIGTGVFEGQATLTFPSDESCTYYRLHPEHIVLSLNDVAVNGTKSITQCVKDGNTVVLGVKYSYTNMTPNATFKLIYRLPGWTLLKAKMYSIIDYTPKDYATNTDIENQTISIINNAIQNAQDIINNSIQENILNRNAITSAVDSAASQIIENASDLANKCENINYSLSSANGKPKTRLGSDGTLIITNNYFTTTEKIKVNENTQYTINYTNNTVNYERICFYKNDININCLNGNGTNSITFTTPNGTNKMAYTIYIDNIGTLIGKFCQSNTDALLEGMTNIERVLYEVSQMEDEDAEEQKGLLQSIISGITGLFSFFDDDDIDDPDNALGNLNNNMGTNNVISSLLLLPVTLYQSVLNNINGTCNSFNLGSLYNHNLTMTCIQPQNYIGSILWGVIDVLISGLFVLHIRKRFVDIFNHLTSLRTGGNELE